MPEEPEEAAAEAPPPEEGAAEATPAEEGAGDGGAKGGRSL